MKGVRRQRHTGCIMGLEPRMMTVMMKVMVTMMMNKSRMMMMHALRSFSEDPLSLVYWCVTYLCEDATLVYDADFASTLARTSTAIWKSSHHRPAEENHCSNLRTFSNSLGLAPRATPSRAVQKSLGAKLRVVPHEPGLKLVCGHRPLILLGRVGVPHDPHREGCNSSTAFVHGLHRLQSGRSRKAHWRPTRLDTLRSARARGTLTSGGQAEKRQCFSRQSPARETKGNALDGAKRQRGTWSLHADDDPEWPRDTEARCHRKGLERKRVEEGGRVEYSGAAG